jgi:hypothetical protein
VDARPVPVKFNVLEPYDVVAVFISAVEVIVLPVEVKLRPRLADELRREAAAAEVTSSASEDEDERSVEVCVLIFTVVSRVDGPPYTAVKNAPIPLNVAGDGGALTADLV